MRNLTLLLVFTTFLFFESCKKQTQELPFLPREKWNDTNGNLINAHGGGILFHEGKYYWFGEIKKGKTWLVEGMNWECYRVNAGGVSCYSSLNLTNWKYEGVALEPNTTDSLHDLHISKVIERPKVIYNSTTKKFVMWFHVDSQDYQYAKAGVAVADKPEGPYTFLYSLRPNGEMSRDQTVFRDDDGKAYHIFSSENNATMHISLLTDDYLQPTGKVNRIFEKKSREAPAIFKHYGKYYLITSGCTGWSPNPAMVAVADSLMGKWTELYNPCVGAGSDTTYGAQSTYVLPVADKPGKFIFMTDRWNKTDLENSRYIWLPLVFRNDSVVIEWKPEWRISDLN